MSFSNRPDKNQTFLDGRISVITGDITELDVDAIVNAANGSLLGGGGVDGAIHRRAGPALLEECRAVRKTLYPEGLPTGEAVITGGGNLPSRHVIHTVGPVYNSRPSDAPLLLASCYTKSLALARDHGLKSAAFPAISTGVYGYPKMEAAGIAFRTVKEFLLANRLPEKVIFVFFTAGDTAIFLKSAEE